MMKSFLKKKKMKMRCQILEMRKKAMERRTKSGDNYIIVRMKVVTILMGSRSSMEWWSMSKGRTNTSKVSVLIGHAMFCFAMITKKNAMQVLAMGFQKMYPAFRTRRKGCLRTKERREQTSHANDDAFKFFLHFLDQVERANSGRPELDPGRCFKFGIKERLKCSSGKVAYNKRVDYVPSLHIPLHETTNKEERKQFQKLKEEKVREGIEVSSDEIVRLMVPLEACLDSYSAPEEVQDFYSTALNTKTTAIKTAGLTSFPDYLMLHMRRFVLEGWLPKKLDVYVDLPDVIYISHMRSKGLEEGEELLPESGPGESTTTEAGDENPYADEDIVSQLSAMGFNTLHCQKSAINTNNAIVEAMNWLLSHMKDPDINDRISQEEKTADVLLSLPDYLVLHMRKFVSEGWVPKKLDVYVDVPDVIYISHMRSKGLEEGEELLLDSGPGESTTTEAGAGKLYADEDIVSQLAAMGFNTSHCQKAAINTSNAGVEEAMSCLLSHMEDPDINELISQEEKTADVLLSFVDESMVDTLVSFGFSKEIAKKALRGSGGNIEQATEWIFGHPDVSDTADAVDSTSSDPAAYLMEHEGTS